MKPAVFLTLILLAACARSENANELSAESNDVPAAQRANGSDGADDQTPAIGEWRDALDDTRPALEFGPTGSPPLLTMVCGDRGGLILQRRGAIAGGSAPTLSVTVGGQSRRLPVTMGTGPIETHNAAIPPGDTLIEQMSAAQAPMALRFADGTQLIVPSSPLIRPFAQRCAGGPAAAAASGNAMDAAAAGNAADAAAPAGNAANAATGR